MKLIIISSLRLTCGVFPSDKFHTRNSQLIVNMVRFKCGQGNFTFLCDIIYERPRDITNLIYLPSFVANAIRVVTTSRSFFPKTYPHCKSKKTYF
jgi:hypothetical protein